MREEKPFDRFRFFGAFAGFGFFPVPGRRMRICASSEPSISRATAAAHAAARESSSMASKPRRS